MTCRVLELPPVRWAVRCEATFTLRHARTGEILRQQTHKNKVVDAGLNQVRDLIGVGNWGPTYVAIGTNTAAPAAGDTTLGNEVARKEITLTDLDVGQVTFQAFFDQSEGNNNTIGEAGLFTYERAGSMLSRVLVSPTIPKDADQTLTVSWEITLTRGSGTNPTVQGLQIAAELLANIGKAPTHIAVGTDGTAPTVNDTALGAEVYRAKVSRRQGQNKRMDFQLYVPAGAGGAATLREAGIFNDPAGGAMFCRVLLSPTLPPVSLPATLTWQYDIAEG